MLIIGHHGSAGTKPENTIGGLRAGIESGADMIHFDVRVSRDGVPVLHHSWRLPHSKDLVRGLTLLELQKRTAGGEFPITTLEAALHECYGKVYTNIEIKEIAAVKPAIAIIKKFARTKKDWDSLLISSFKPLVLRRVRQNVQHADLALLHNHNPLNFLGWNRSLQLSAVGFHRLRVSAIAVEAAKRLELFTYVYTVNRKKAAVKLADKNIDGIITDYPAQMIEELGLNN